MEDLTKVDFSFKQFFVPMTTLKAINIIFIVGLIVFFNTLFNGFVGDDKKMIVDNPQEHVVNPALSFGENAFNVAGQYRPIPATYFSFLYAVFGNNSFFYHFFEALLHILCGVLLYLFARKFFSYGTALLLSLIFIVHPINEEVAVYIADFQDVFFMFLGLLLLLTSTKKGFSRIDLAVIFSLSLLSLLTKETGVLFLLLALIYSFLFAKRNALKLLVECALAIVVYLFFRFFIGHVGFGIRSLAPIASLSLPERLLNIPALVFYYLKILFFPRSLAFDQQWVVTSLSFSTFYLPLIVDALFFTALALSGFFIFMSYRQRFRQYLFFSAWFLLGVILLLQIYPLDMTVADRWFYFPMAGLLGILGILYQRVAQTLLKHSVVSVSLSIIVIFSLVLITILRNSDWQNAIKLYTHDIQISDNYHIEISLGAEYARAGAYQEALHSFERSAALRPYEYNLLNMGVTYAAMGNIERAKSFHKKALQAKTYDLFLPHKHSLKLYVSYAELMLFYDSTSQALSFTQTALRDYPDSSELWNVLALAKHKEHDIQGAMDAATKAYQLNPNNQFAETYTQFFNNGQPVNVFYDDKNFTF